jgi:XTP/dITP diphosphohydrolase
MEVAEDATTLEDNARLKAEAYARASGRITLADDTGLEVDALNGEPGIYPARYGGPGLTMEQRRRKLLDGLAGVPDEQRTAHFICVLAIANPQTGRTQTVRAVCDGWIASIEDTGGSGFGYDPVFIPAGYSIPFSQMPAEEKNRVSHRGRAAMLAADVLKRMAADLSAQKRDG